MAIPIDSSWTLTFDEEFNGKSINTDVWGTNWLGKDGAVTKPINSEEIVAYDPAQVSVSDGFLHLNAIRAPVTVDGKSHDYRSGLVHTHDSFSQAYGYFEAKLYLPGSNGLIDNWPAFWLDGENWPADGELDVMEGLGGRAAYHFHSNNGESGTYVKEDFTGWHTFGALWEPGKVKFYYDNHFVGSITSGVTDSPQFIILNLGIGINSIVDVPSEMLVDWVHAYSIDPHAKAVTPQAHYEGPGGNPLYQFIKGTQDDDKLQGSNVADQIVGREGDDRLAGYSSNDSLAGGNGNDVLVGGRGRDILAGGQGADWLAGGKGADTFVFTSILNSSPGSANLDMIADFRRSSGDKIDLSGIDADITRAGDQSFDFIGDAHFSKHAGELRYMARSDGAYVYGDVDGDGQVDLAIQIANLDIVRVADFIL